MQCAYCGSQIPDGLKFCSSCGASLSTEAAGAPTYESAPANAGAQQPVAQQPYQQPYNQAQPVYAQPEPQVKDSGSIGWAILGFFIPIVGLILFLVWKGTKPNCAKMAGIGALVGFCINVAYMVFGGGVHTLLG